MKPRRAIFLVIITVMWAHAALADAPPPQSVVITKPAVLAGGFGAAKLKPGDCLDLIKAGDEPWVVMTGPGGRAVPGRVLAGPRRAMGVKVVLFQPASGPGPWWMPEEWLSKAGKPSAKGDVQAQVLAMGRLPQGAFAPLPGPARAHRKRLAKLAKANVGTGVARRLMAGIIQQGDTFWLVELAWGKPQRSIMVNLIMDEQHYVYIGRAPKPIILRFEGGHLVPPLPEKYCLPAKAGGGN